MTGAAAVSADGRFVAFRSSATNLVTGDANQCCGPQYCVTCSQIYVRDLQNNTTERVNVCPCDGKQANHLSKDPAISADGVFVAFTSAASNLLSDRLTRMALLMFFFTNGSISSRPSI